MRKLFKEKKLIKGGNYMRKYSNLKYVEESLSTVRLKYITLFTFVQMDHLYYHRKT